MQSLQGKLTSKTSKDIAIPYWNIHKKQSPYRWKSPHDIIHLLDLGNYIDFGDCIISFFFFFFWM